MKSVLLFLISIYQKYVSPTIVRLFGHSCRFKPTCSEYAKEAIAKHGVIKGFYYSILRILRCNPFSKTGFDPVP